MHQWSRSPRWCRCCSNYRSWAIETAVGTTSKTGEGNHNSPTVEVPAYTDEVGTSGTRMWQKGNVTTDNGSTSLRRCSRFKYGLAKVTCNSANSRVPAYTDAVGSRSSTDGERWLANSANHKIWAQSKLQMAISTPPTAEITSLYRSSRHKQYGWLSHYATNCRSTSQIDQVQVVLMARQMILHHL